MKKRVSFVTAMLFSLQPPAFADTVLGLHAGADYWAASTDGGFANSRNLPSFNFNEHPSQGYYVALEHLVPVLPNVRFNYQNVTANGFNTLMSDFVFSDVVYTAGSELTTSLDLRHTDYILYYELLDNALMELDLGVSVKQLKGEVMVESQTRRASQDISQWLPLLYLDTKIGLPATGFDVFVSGQATRLMGSHYFDIQTGLGYQLVDNMLVDVRVKVGYRTIDAKLDDLNSLYAELEFKGVFAGISIHF